MKSIPLSRSLTGLAAASLILCTLGCDSGPQNPPTFPVTGKVTFKGKPVEGATVVLVAESSSSKGAVGNTDAEGNYEMGTFGKGDGAVAGSYKVKVFKYEMKAEPPADGDDVMSEEEEEEEYGGVEDEDDASGGNLLPAKYEDPRKSGFAVEVTDQPVTLDLELK
ncbi:MAG: carboxypeptidase-like regulatory domain-containing protein [Aureliella sp.]